MRMYSEKISLDLEEEKKTRDAIGMLRISERTLEIDEELSVCFTDWQKAFDRVNWTKLMQIQLGFRRGKKTRDAIGMLRISERTLEIDEGLSVCFIDWQKAFDRVNWTKLMQILKETGIDWRERRSISNLYMAQSVKV